MAARHLALILIALAASPALSQEAPDLLRRVLQWSNEAVAAADEGRTAESRALLDQAGRSALTLPRTETVAASVLANWAQSRIGEGRWESGETIAREAAARAEELGAPALRLRANRIHGEALRLLGRPDDAEVALASAAAARGSLPPGEAAEIAELDFSLALLALDRARYEEALLPLSRAIGAARDLERQDLELRARLANAEALAGAGRVQDADFELDLAREIAEGPRDRADVEQRSAHLHRTDGRSEDAARSVTRMLRAIDRWIDDALTPEEKRARAAASRSYVETAIAVRLPEGRRLAAWPAARTWIRRVRGEADVPPESNEYHALWFWGADAVTGLITPPGEATRVVHAGHPEPLREWILLFRSLLASPERVDERRQVGAWLVASLFGDHPPDEGDVRVEPDGPLVALPFALLPTPGPTATLGLDAGLVQGPRQSTPGAAPESYATELLVLADPRPPTSAPLRSPLPGARREAHRIAGRVPGTRKLFAEAATEASLAGATIPSVLHVAAHTSPDASRPALFLAPGEGRDGWLTPDEIRRLPRVPQVVVLSSCESLLTDVSGRSSVGAVGSAFLDAGTSTVVGALWKVEDDGPAALMAAFHAHLQSGRRPSEAMRLARTEVTRAADADAFAWGAFVVRGRDEPVARPTPSEPGNRAEAALGAGMALAFAAVLLRARWRRAAPRRSP